jgi:ribosome-associated protein
MIPIAAIEQELSWKTSRSSGKGGQNVNKVETKVELLWDFNASALLSDVRKTKITEKLTSAINKEGQLSVTCETSRSQLKNKELAIKKLNTLLQKAFAEKKKRLATKPSKSSVEKKLTEKKNRGTIKAARKKVNPED